jgi:hypothetical protein
MCYRLQNGTARITRQQKKIYFLLGLLPESNRLLSTQANDGDCKDELHSSVEEFVTRHLFLGWHTVLCPGKNATPFSQRPAVLLTTATCLAFRIILQGCD